eukprot:6175449-Prymnesium_polylepis.1
MIWVMIRSGSRLGVDREMGPGSRGHGSGNGVRVAVRARELGVCVIGQGSGVSCGLWPPAAARPRRGCRGHPRGKRTRRGVSASSW